MSKIKLLDGAMGTELIHRGISLSTPVWSADANINNSEIVYQIHADYVASGSDYIIANTFRTTKRFYVKLGLSSNDAMIMAKTSLKSSVRLAKKASCENTKILGSIAPLEDCYMPSLFPGPQIAKQEFSEIGNLLVQEEIDGFILETMNNMQETQVCLEVISQYNLPIWVSYNLSSSSNLLSGENLTDGLKILEEYPVSCVLLNCNPLDRTMKGINIIEKYWKKEWGIYPNLGIGEPAPDGIIKKFHSDSDFLDLMNKAVELGANVLGGCCGSTPHHIKILKEHFVD